MADEVILDAIQKLEERIYGIYGQMQALHGEMLRRFDAVDQRFDAVDERFDAEHDWSLGHFGAIYHRFDRLETEYQALRAAVRRIEDGQPRPM